jgi:hypothetical protein
MLMEKPMIEGISRILGEFQGLNVLFDLLTVANLNGREEECTRAEC